MAPRSQSTSPTTSTIIPIVHTIAIPVTNPIRRRIKPQIITMSPVLVPIFRIANRCEFAASKGAETCAEIKNYLRRAAPLALSIAFTALRSAFSAAPSTLLFTRPTFSFASPARRSILPSDSNSLSPVRLPTATLTLPFESAWV